MVPIDGGTITMNSVMVIVMPRTKTNQASQGHMRSFTTVSNDIPPLHSATSCDGQVILEEICHCQVFNQSPPRQLLERMTEAIRRLWWQRFRHAKTFKGKVATKAQEQGTSYCSWPTPESLARPLSPWLKLKVGYSYL